jgi:hypothetical protein
MITRIIITAMTHIFIIVMLPRGTAVYILSSESGKSTPMVHLKFTGKSGIGALFVGSAARSGVR